MPRMIRSTPDAPEEDLRSLGDEDEHMDDVLVRDVVPPPPPPPSGNGRSLATRSSLQNPFTRAVLDDVPVALAESMRYLVARLQLRDDTDFPDRLGVTSALHGEGVTTVSRTLAAIVANDLDRRVCWVDLTSRGASKRGPAPAGHIGIGEVLSGEASLDEALDWTEDRRLSVLGPGAVPAGQGDAIARSSAIGELLNLLSDRFDCLILDTPPVLAGSASLGLLRHASAYLLVVRHGVTSTQQVRAATDELASIPSLGVVLNGYKSKIPKRLSHFFVA